MGGKIAFSGIPNQGEQNQKWSPTKGNKIRSGSLTPTFSGAQRRAEMLRHPCLLSVPEHGFKKGPHRANGKQWKKAPHGGPRWFRITLQPTFLKRKKKRGS